MLVAHALSADNVVDEDETETKLRAGFEADVDWAVREIRTVGKEPWVSCVWPVLPEGVPVDELERTYKWMCGWGMLRSDVTTITDLVDDARQRAGITTRVSPVT